MAFLINPAELETRRERCRPVVQSVSTVERQFVSRCNLCGSEQSCIIGYHDRYGLPLRTAMCVGCGLIYLMDRFTQEGYAQFYLDGAYRKLTSAFAGSVATIEDLQADQAAYARNLVRFLDRRVPQRQGVRLLDIGGSSGEVAKELAGRFGIEGTVLDPSREEIEAARRQGLHGIVGSAESWETDQRFDVVMLCRTIEHLYDLRATMAKVRRYLTPGGLFYCDFLDYMELCRMTGAPQTVSKVDHCYWLTLQTAPAIFRAMGFEIVSLHVVPKPQFIGCLLRQCEPVAVEPMQWLEVQPLIRDLQQIVTEWQRPGPPASLPARVKRKVKRLAAGRA
jgi:2-polyprenyl-3-methyl-5-hydroxy-6-metoxy-1,4-benzoquinol methylase